ncbi:MAG: hypothetical protein JW984_15250 [Deltaproteobacteria bacterium]|uniref:Uncharacterized protein n=1 Tax=Candidatus Zymogenus saltonus TaxID=2844893 RepID=A0A9D8KHE4_9DELT|nr:hypothetical protein [Candidatus Zymogenus saltonus]
MTLYYKDEDFELTIYDDRVLAVVEENGLKNMKKACILLRNKTVRLVKTSPASGRIYFRRRGRPEKRGEVKGIGDYIVHRASAPGEPPATDRGLLIMSCDWRVSKDEEGILGEAGSNVKYDDALEFGSVNMAPRPHWRPALNNNREKLVETIVKGLIPDYE